MSDTKKNTITARHVEVNCKEKEIVDLSDGKNKFIGFDFYISPDEDFEKIKKFIENELKLNSSPLHSIVDKGEVEIASHRVLSKKKIKASIKEAEIV